VGGLLLSLLWSAHEDERGDVPGWVMIVLMTASLVVAIWGIARDRLVAIVASALSTVCGPIGC
jgi:hypothetical protein